MYLLGTWLDRGLLPGEALFPAAAAGSAISFDVLHFSLNRAESPSFYFSFFANFSNFQTAITHDSKRSISSYRGGSRAQFFALQVGDRVPRPKTSIFSKKLLLLQKRHFFPGGRARRQHRGSSEWVPGFVSEWVSIKNQLNFMKIN